MVAVLALSLWMSAATPVAVVRLAVDANVEALQVLDVDEAVISGREGAAELHWLRAGRLRVGSETRVRMGPSAPRLMRGRVWLLAENRCRMTVLGRRLEVDAGTSVVVDAGPAGFVVAVRHGTARVEGRRVRSGEVLDVDGRLRPGGQGLFEATARELEGRLGLSSAWTALTRLPAPSVRDRPAVGARDLRFTGDPELFGNQNVEQHLLEQALRPPPVPESL
jgi:hypothetical protein